MKKLSYYLILIVVAGLATVSFWVYQKYFRQEKPAFLLFPVERGSIQEVVRVRGEVVSQKEFNLELPFSGIIEKIYVKEGQSVSKGAPLVKLETTDLEIEIQKLSAVLDQRKANLNKLLSGATQEEINISEAKVSSAKIALEDAKQGLIDKIQDAYTKSDDAIKSKTDQWFSNPRSSNPQVNLSLSDGQLKTSLESGRVAIESMLVAWNISLSLLNKSSNLSDYAFTANKNLNQTKQFLDITAIAINTLTPGANLTQTAIDSWRSDVSTARANINTALTNFSSAQEKLRSAESSLSVAENELIFKKSGTRKEDLDAAQAGIKEAESQIASVRDKVRKSILSAPAQGMLNKIWLEEGEIFRPGQPAVSLNALGQKIQADVSELDIYKIREVNGNNVAVQFDAFPGQDFKGKVFSIEPKEIIKEGDKYYRIIIYLEKSDEAVRNGMSADLKIMTSFKNDVIKIPALTVYEKGGKKFVKVLPSGQKAAGTGSVLLDSEIETGISDGELVEVIKGLTDGQTVAVSAE
ncbi:MAG: efflux RND transporter periplasmic adaptor subunit [Candidatus Harrisonbacteria bacterium]|nr:efflux RND transporter periplasmic adaptor subunit [Candidatus Harrisonbacteria bacterium]